MGSNGITQIGSFTVYSVDENGNTECLGTLDGVESIEVITKVEPEDGDKAEMIFSLLKPNDEAYTFTGKLTLRTRIKLRFLWWKSKVQGWLMHRKFKRSFNKAAKAQTRYGRRIHHD